MHIQIAVMKRPNQFQTEHDSHIFRAKADKPNGMDQKISNQILKAANIYQIESRHPKCLQMLASLNNGKCS